MAVGAGLEADSGVSVDVCLVTFRRPQVAETLRSIARQRDIAGVRLRVVVADNDDKPSARDLVAEVAAETGLPIDYVHAPARNISIGRNACLRAARATWIAFIDDDETADPDWISRLLAEARDGACAAVLGRVQAVYTDSAPAWVREGDFHSIGPVIRNGRIDTGYTCNALLRREAVAGMSFDLAYGRSGGEDLDFFYRLTDAGGRIGYAPDAVVREVVPVERTTCSWLFKRWYRYGQSHGVRLRAIHHGLSGRAAAAAVAFAKACVLGAAALLALPSAVRRTRFLLRAVMHLGVVSRLAGAKLVHIYGSASPALGGAEAAAAPPTR